MSDPTNPLDWVVKAEEDYTLAQSSLRRKAPLLYGAGFHAQQCAEKYLKALLAACRSKVRRHYFEPVSRLKWVIVCCY